MADFKEYESYDGLGLAELVRHKQVSPQELLDAALTRVERHDPKIAACCHLVEDVARKHIAKGLSDGPFAGVPFLLKDLGCEAKDFPASSGSRLFANTPWTFDSEIFLRLERTGIVTFGRTTSPEGGIGPATEAQVYGKPTRNPWHLEHTSGGSSGGSGAAVAAGITPIAHGSDGGGSVRIPASSCGLVGLKPTRARLPDGPASGEGWGGMAIDGFLTRSVRDTAALLDATHGPDLGAPYWAPAVAWPFLEEIKTPPKRLKVAVSSKTFSGAATHPECQAAVARTANLLAGLGHEIIEAAPAIDILKLMRSWADIVAAGTALSVEAAEKARGRKAEDHELEGVTWGAIEHARTVRGADYLAALNVVHASGRRMARFLADYDVLLTPTLAEPPAKVGRFKPVSRDFLDYRLGPNGVLPYSPFTALFNATGQPAISLPLHWTPEGLPVGVHFAAKFGEDALLLKLAAEIEQASPWFDKRPGFTAA
jgi:amidase/6-aminohexanoate-cyclic-dimer hydrolase